MSKENNKTISFSEAKKKQKAASDAVSTTSMADNDEVELSDEEYERQEAERQDFLWEGLQDGPMGEILVSMSAKASDAPMEERVRNRLLAKYGFNLRTATGFDLWLCATAEELEGKGQSVDICDLRSAILEDRFHYLFDVLQMLDAAQNMLLGFGVDVEEEE